MECMSFARNTVSRTHVCTTTRITKSPWFPTTHAACTQHTLGALAPDLELSGSLYQCASALSGAKAVGRRRVHRGIWAGRGLCLCRQIDCASWRQSSSGLPPFPCSSGSSEVFYILCLDWVLDWKSREGQTGECRSLIENPQVLNLQYSRIPIESPLQKFRFLDQVPTLSHLFCGSCSRTSLTSLSAVARWRWSASRPERLPAFSAQTFPPLRLLS